MSLSPTLLALFLTGCADTSLGPTVDTPPQDPQRAWRRVLQASTEGGLVDHARIAKDQAKLERFIAWAAEHGPIMDKVRESREDKRLAALLNAHTALILRRNLALAGMPGAQIPPVDPGHVLGSQAKVDGSWPPMAHLAEVNIVARYQEPLLWMGLGDGSIGQPPLRWWSPTKLQENLEEALSSWLAEGGLQAQGEGHTLAPFLVDHAEDFVHWSSAETLCAYLAPHAQEGAAAWLTAHAVDCPLQPHEDRRELRAAPPASP